MCGIAGYVAVKQFDERFRVTLPILGLFMQNRGSDAWGWTDGEKIVKKTGAFAGGVSYRLYGKIHAAVHTRHATHGSKDEQKNAHPFKIGSIIGMHNGIIYNHDELNKQYGRNFEVDSMHIFAHLDEGKDLSELRGYGAVCFVHNGLWHLGRFNNGDLSVAHIPDVGWAWASTRSSLETALGMSGFEDGIIWLRLKEGRCYVIDGHNIKKSPNFKLNIGERPWNSRDWNSYGCGVNYTSSYTQPEHTQQASSKASYTNLPAHYYGGKGQDYGKQLKSGDKEEHTVSNSNSQAPAKTLEEEAIHMVAQALNTQVSTAKADKLPDLARCTVCEEPNKDGFPFYLNGLDESVCEKCAQDMGEGITDLRGPYKTDLDIKPFFVSEVSTEQGDIFCDACGNGFFDSEKAYDVNPTSQPYILCIECLEEDYLSDFPVDEGSAEFVPKPAEEAIDDATAEVSKTN